VAQRPDGAPQSSGATQGDVATGRDLKRIAQGLEGFTLAGKGGGLEAGPASGEGRDAAGRGGPGLAVGPAGGLAAAGAGGAPSRGAEGAPSRGIEGAAAAGGGPSAASQGEPPARRRWDAPGRDARGRPGPDARRGPLPAGELRGGASMYNDFNRVLRDLHFERQERRLAAASPGGGPGDAGDDEAPWQAPAGRGGTREAGTEAR